ncbi:hypothetical protein Hanom_Chr04g00366441 [Helianthus anomalus]
MGPTTPSNPIKFHTFKPKERCLLCLLGSLCNVNFFFFLTRITTRHCGGDSLVITKSIYDAHVMLNLSNGEK